MATSWLSLVGELTALAAGVALSPFSVIPAIALVAQSNRPRPVGVAFVAGWLAGKAAITLAFVELPRLVHTIDRPAPQWANWVRLGIGVVLCLAALWAWRRPSTVDGGTPRWLDRLERMTPATACAAGVAMTVVNFKVLLLCAAAGYVIGTRQLSGAEIALATTYFTAVAGSSAVIPILAYTIWAHRIDGYLRRFRAWLLRHQRGLTVGILLVLGVALVVSGARAL